MAEFNSRESKFLVSKTEVRVPTLLLGIGGIGGRIVSAVYDQLSLKDRSVVQMAVLDTNINDISDVGKKGILCIQTSEDKTVSAYLDDNPRFFDWFPNNPLISSKNLIDGAGQIRAVSRLGGLSSEQAGNFNKIKECIDKLSREKGDDLKKLVKVMIVGSITGGTGSGLGIQLPFFIRSLFGSDTEILIRGLFLCADIVEEKQKTTDSKKAVYVNEYAFIRELNAFYKAQVKYKEDFKISVEHYEPTRSKNDPPAVENKNPAPYDFMFLLEKNSTRRSNLGGLSIYESKAAKIVRSQLFSPVSGNQYSAEDNLIIARVEKNGMNGYCSAGFSSAVYPQADVEKYCTLRYTAESVSEQWLHIDKSFKAKSREQRKLMKESPSFAPLNLRAFYMQEFERYTDPREKDTPYYLARLSEEIKRKEYDADGKVIGSTPFSEVILSEIEAYLEKQIEDLGLNRLKEACKVRNSDFAEYSSAAQNARTLINKIETYSETARKKVGEIAVVCAGAILPASFIEEPDDGTVKEIKPYSIYDSFKSCHPLTVRYLIYFLIRLLKEQKENEDASLKSCKPDGLGRDFYPKTEEIDDIETAFDLVEPSRLFQLFKSILCPTSSSNGKKYDEVVSMLRTAVDEETAYIERVTKGTLYSTVYGILIKRLEVLAKVYEDFFEEMNAIVSNCETDLNVLESKYSGIENRVIDGDVYLCADFRCLEAIYDDVGNNMTSDPSILSDYAKNKLFAELYTVAEKRIDRANGTRSAANKEKSMRSVFDDGVLAPISAELLAEGSNYTDLGILKAIEREYDVYAGYGLTEAHSKKEYLQEIFRKIAIIATPYLDYTAYNSQEIPVAVSYGINTDIIRKYFGVDADSLDTYKSVVEDFFRQPGVASNTPIAADSFSPNELVCYNAVYDLNVENINRYRDGGKAHKHYRERLKNVIDQTFKLDGAPDSYLSIVHPHLDKRWNSRAYLPLLIEESDIREDKFVKLSFLLSLAIGACKFDLDYDAGYCWRYYTAAGVNSIYVNRQEVINNAGLEALLEGLDYNEPVKNDVLARALDMTVRAEKAAPITGTTVSTIVNQELIERLCDIEQFITGSRDGIRTVYDIIYTVYCKTRDINLANGLIKAFAGFICDYCYGMSNRKTVTAMELLAAVIEKIQTASACYAPSEKDAPDLYLSWNGTFREESFQGNLDYLELSDYLVAMK